MNTYSNILSRGSIFLAMLALTVTVQAKQSLVEEGAPSSNEKLVDAENVSPAATLQIVSITPFTYNGGVNIRCWGQNTGRATVLVSGGTAPYSYMWSGLPNQTGPMAIGMSAGAYTVVVTDADGASVSGSVTLIQNPPLQAIATPGPIACFGGVSVVVITATGGTSPIAGLVSYEVVPGTYYFTVGDANGCRNRDTITVTEPMILDVTATPTPIFCFGDTSQVTVAATGGTHPYSGTGVFDEVAGSYSYVVTDANGCTDNTTLSINQPGLLITNAVYTPINCFGGASQVTVSVISGSEPFFGAGTFIEVAGVHNYTVVDNLGCEDMISVNLIQPDELIVTIAASTILCNGGTSTVVVDATGGVGPYAGTGTFARGSGTYTFTIVDANGCSSDAKITINEPPLLEQFVTWDPILCNGGTTNMTITASGGTGQYTGTGSFTVSAGSNSYVVNDANGCTVSQNVTIPEPAQPVLATAVFEPILCNGAQTDVTIVSIGNSGPLIGTGTFTVGAGNYVFTVSNAIGCSSDVHVFVPEASIIEANVSPQNQTIDCIPIPVAIFANPTGGSGPYSYLWSNGSTASSIMVNPNETTTYSVSITDANGCTQNAGNNTSTVSVQNRCGEKNKKVLICHVPAGNPSNAHTICISPNALSAHFNGQMGLHGGDYCGPCSGSNGNPNALIIADNTDLGNNSFIRAAINTNTDLVELSYRLTYDSPVRIEIYDMTGALVEVIHENNANEGELYNLSVLPEKFTTGVYIYQFITDQETHIDKMQFVK